GQPVTCAQLKPPPRRRLGVAERVFRDIECDDHEPGTDAHQVRHQEALGAAHVEDLVAWPEPEVRHDVPRDRHPAAIVAIAAVALLTRAVEVFGPEPEGGLPVRGVERAGPGQLARRPRVVTEQVDLGHHSRSKASRWTRARPFSKGTKTNSGKARRRALTSK